MKRKIKEKFRNVCVVFRRQNHDWTQSLNLPTLIIRLLFLFLTFLFVRQYLRQWKVCATLELAQSAEHYIFTQIYGCQLYTKTTVLILSVNGASRVTKIQAAAAAVSHSSEQLPPFGIEYLSF